MFSIIYRIGLKVTNFKMNLKTIQNHLFYPTWIIILDRFCAPVLVTILASPEGRLSGDGVAVLRFPECLLDGLLVAAPGPLACPSRGARPPSQS